METKIAITACESLSALGKEKNIIWKNYQNQQTYISQQKIGNQIVPAASFSEEILAEIKTLQQSDSKYKNLDASVLYAIEVSRRAIAKAGWKKGDDFGINFGSSRGATSLFEKYHTEFTQTNRVSTLASPTTTLGNISSWVANDLQSNGPEISHSITCSTSLHSLLNGVAWIKAGMVDKFLVGGSEAPLTPFTIAQMQALKIYSRIKDEYPCRAFDFSKTENSMVIGEGACAITLETVPNGRQEGESKKALAYIEGLGYATEILEHNISISAEADCFQKSMQMALQNTNLEDIDAIVMHAPGTIKGDKSEYKAIQKVFGSRIPFLTTNKWKIGHTFGASGILSLELALLMLQNQEIVEIPFFKQEKPQKLNKILVNAVGFGGNAVSILISKDI